MSPRQMALDEDDPAPALLAPVEPAVPQARRSLPALAVAWAVSLLIVIGGLVYLFAGRERIMHAWPPSVRAYAAVGLATPAVHGEGQ